MKWTYVLMLGLFIIGSGYGLVDGFAATSISEWVRTGGPLGGLGYDVRMKPNAPDIMYVTDSFAGVFKSTDGGKNWFISSKGITTRTGQSGDAIPVFSLTIDPNQQETIWAGTQNQTGIFKSTDGGASWKKMVSGISEQGLTFRGFTIDPHNSDVVYAAGEISSWEYFGRERRGKEFDMTGGAVYKTTNGGKSWKRVWLGDNLARYIWIDPGNSNIVYVSTGIFDREAANSDYKKNKPGGVGILISEDGGQTWQAVYNGLKNLYIGTLFMHPQDSKILLAGAGNVSFSDGSGVYLSKDGGETWKQKLSSYIIESVEFSVSDPNIAYAGGYGGVYRSGDGGNTWNQMAFENWGPAGTMVGHPIDFQVDPRDPNRLFVNSYGGGNFLSMDGGKTWEEASKGYTGALMKDMVVDSSQPAHIVAVGRSGIFASFNGGGDWHGIMQEPARFLDWHSIAMDPSNPQHMITGLTCLRKLAETHDGGKTWNFVAESGPLTAWMTIVFAPSNPSIVYGGTAGFFSCGLFDLTRSAQGIMVSRDGGINWLSANSSLTEKSAVSSLSVHPTQPDIVYAVTSQEGLIKTTDGGKKWERVTNDRAGKVGAITVAVHPSDPNLIFVGHWQKGIYRSNDEGKTWKSIQRGLVPEASIIDIVFSPKDPKQIFIADYHSGVYRSDDGGDSWKAVNNGLRMRSVTTLALSTDGYHLYAGTEGDGVYRLDLNGRPPETASPDKIFTRIQTTPTEVSGESLLYSQDFDKGLPSDWIIEDGWDVKDVEGKKVLVGKEHIWARFDIDNWTDYRERFKIMLETKAALHANIRIKGADRYFIGFYPQKSYISKQIGLNKFQDHLVTGQGIPTGWHDVEISAIGNMVTVLLDGRKLMEYQDPNPLVSGGIAFESLENAQVSISDVEVWGKRLK